MTATRNIWQEIDRLYYESQQTRRPPAVSRQKLVKTNRR